MTLPVNPPVLPMLAKAVKALPTGDDLLYEPKWDGFRSLAFVDEGSVELASRNAKSLTRYFPELVPAVRDALPARCVVDGEIVIAGPGGLDFDGLQNRIHPAASRVKKLAEETPAALVLFDLLALDEKDLRGEPFAERRRLLEASVAANESVHLTPATTDPAVAHDWFTRFEGAGLDGVIAKHGGLPYRSDERVMYKLKHQRTADCVVAGYRMHTKDGVGSLLLGLYDDEGRLHHVGVASSFAAPMRRELLETLKLYELGPDDPHPWAAWAQPPAGTRMPGGQSRWSSGRDQSFTPLRIELVCEVAYDHLQGDRFRHVASFQRWRPDRDPESCTYGQLEAVVPEELAALFGPAVSDG